MGKKVVLLVGDAVEDYEVPLNPALQCQVSRSSWLTGHSCLQAMVPLQALQMVGIEVAAVCPGKVEIWCSLEPYLCLTPVSC